MDDAVWAFMFMLAMVISFFFGAYQGMQAQKSFAVDKGVAHYVVDPKTGNTGFVYGCPTTESNDADTR